MRRAYVCVCVWKGSRVQGIAEFTIVPTRLFLISFQFRAVHIVREIVIVVGAARNVDFGRNFIL